MKKILLPLVIVMLCVVAAKSQSLSLKLEDDVVSNDTVYVIGTVEDELLEFHLKVKNHTDKEISVKVKKNEISLVENSVNTFCWGSCFMPHIYISPAPIVIRANGTDFNSFAGDYEPYENEGTSIISYTFFNIENEDDSVMVTAFYQVGAAGIEGLELADNLKVYPNPVDNQINIDFGNSPDKPWSIRLLGMNGQVLRELAVNTRESKHSFNVEGLSGSVLILEMKESEGKAIRKKVLFR